MENIVIDFVKELAACRVAGTQLPFYPEKVKGYTEKEIELITETYNLDVHGQFREFLLQMGKCSGGLLWSDEFYIYKHFFNKDYFVNYQAALKEDEGVLLTSVGKIDPIEKKIFYLTQESDTYFYYLCTAEQGDYIWSLHDVENEVLKKENYTLLEYLKHYVRQKTNETQFINFDLMEKQIDRYITGRLL